VRRISVSIKRGQEEAKRVDFDQHKVTIGSAALCDIIVRDPGVDPQQAILVERGDDVELFDVGVGGGVLVNGRKVSHMRVTPGDEIWVGGTSLTLVADTAGGVAFTEGATTVRAEVKAPAKPARPVRQTTGDEQQFALFNEVRNLINSIGTNEDIFESILDTLFHSVPVRRGFIGLLDADGELQVKAHRNREAAEVGGGPIEVSRTLLGKVLQTGNAVLTSDAEADPEFQAAMSIHSLRIKAAICVPLMVEDKVTGLVYGDNREMPGALTKAHLSILSMLASVAAVAVEKFRLLDEYDQKQKIEQALAIARTIQLNFLPSGPPENERFEAWGHSDSCDETGGDYYDFFPLEEGRLGVVIADVTGHGIGPALLMATVRSALRALVAHEQSPEKLVARLNELIREDVQDGRFITLFLGIFDPAGLTLHSVGAGHTPPVWYRTGDGSTHLIKSLGPPLGILPGIPFEAGETLTLAPGDVLLFTTDGVMEAANGQGEQFGMERLQEVVANAAGDSARDIVETVCDQVDVFSEGRPLRDDSTLVAVKVLA